MFKSVVSTLFLASILVVVSGCESVGNPSFSKMFGAASQMQQWVGKHRDALVKEWGPPAEEKAWQNGTKSGHTLLYSRPYRMPGQHAKWDAACELMFQTDHTGIVTAWAYSGC